MRTAAIREALLSDEDSIFEHLSEYSPPWTDDLEETEIEELNTALNMEYLFNHSGLKTVSPLVDALIATGGGTTPISYTAFGQIARIIAVKYMDNWKRLWDANMVQYAPIDNYSMTEITAETDREYGYESQGNSGGTDISVDTTHGKTETTTHGMTDNVEDYTYGFNSGADGAKSDATVETQGGTTAVANTGTDSVVTDNDWTENKRMDRDMASTVNKTLTRKGNIGVTTSQAMLREEREARKWVYFEQVFTDMDEVLTIPFYDFRYY